jgi:hypothetical protein
MSAAPRSATPPAEHRPATTRGRCLCAATAAPPDRPHPVVLFLYWPVEDALPVYVAHGLHAHAGLLGAYWTSFGVGALASTLLAEALRSRATMPVTLLIVSGWGACLVPFGASGQGRTWCR